MSSRSGFSSAARSPYLLLLSVLGILLLVYPFWNRDLGGIATLDLLLWGVLLASLYVINQNKQVFRFALALALCAFAGDLGAYLFVGPTTLFVSCLLDLAALLFVTGAIIASVMQQGRVGADKIFGAASGYVLIALVWTLAYGALELYQPGSFAIQGSSPSLRSHDQTGLPLPHLADLDDFIYFSLVTLTTLGYGDMVAVSRAARSFAALEALVGQFYLAVLVARLIGLHIREATLRIP